MRLKFEIENLKEIINNELEIKDIFQVVQDFEKKRVFIDNRQNCQRTCRANKLKLKIERMEGLQWNF